IAIVSAVFYPEPWGNNVDAGGNNLSNVNWVSADVLNGTTILGTFTGEVTGSMNWTFLKNYPTVCPAGTFITLLNDSVTCTAPVADDIDPGDFPAGNYSFDTNVLFIDSSNDRVGIGTASPNALLDVNGAIRTGSNFEIPSGGKILFHDVTSGNVEMGGTNTARKFVFSTGSTTEQIDAYGSGATEDVEFRLAIEGATVMTLKDGKVGIPAVSVSDTLLYVQTPNTDATGTRVGIQSRARKTTSTTNSNLIYGYIGGSQLFGTGNHTTEAMGIQGQVTYVGTGFAHTIVGVSSAVQNFNTLAGTMTNAYNYQARIDAEDGTIINAYGFRGWTPKIDTGNIENFYWIYLNDFSGADNNNRGVVLASDTMGLTLGLTQDVTLSGSGDGFFFDGGNVGIGTATPQNTLNVIGDGNFTGNLTVGQKITFALGEIIDNIVDGWITITGNLN
ncbi:hypothetical protein LCGC14_2666510, partial [marine sediment metagenome]